MRSLLFESVQRRELSDEKRDCMSNLRFADDVLMMAISLKQLNRQIPDFKKSTKVQGLEIHPDKTKILTVVPETSIKHENERRRLTWRCGWRCRVTVIYGSGRSIYTSLLETRATTDNQNIANTSDQHCNATAPQSDRSRRQSSEFWWQGKRLPWSAHDMASGMTLHAIHRRRGWPYSRCQSDGRTLERQ